MGTHGLTYCACLQGVSIAATMSTFPLLCQTLVEVYTTRQDENEAFESSRQKWLDATVVPALLHSTIFAEFPTEVLCELGQGLEEQLCEPGDVITYHGEEADSLVVLLDGEADVESKSGGVVGRFSKCAVYGELIVLGLMCFHTATVRATSPCSVLAVPAWRIHEVLSKPSAKPWRQLFEETKRRRFRQMEEVLPISALPCGFGV